MTKDPAIIPQLVVLGAGPKACAIWTKHKALADEAVSVAAISVIEKTRIAANWSGANGYH